VIRQDDSKSICVLLSQTLVAFTIECDNEAENRMPHRTTADKASPVTGPWLTSLVMYENCLRHVPEEGITVSELIQTARTETNLPGMTRWGYLVTDLPERPHTLSEFKGGTLLRPTRSGRLAKKIWSGVAEEIEGRWATRFGQDHVEAIRSALGRIAARLSPALPDCMPILGYGLRCNDPSAQSLFLAQPIGDFEQNELPLHALLSKVLLAFALCYEARSKISLALGANILRVLSGDVIPLRDLPLRGGVSKESVAMATRFLETHGCVLQEPLEEKSRGVGMLLTEKGKTAQEKYFSTLASVEKDWNEHLGEDALIELRQALVRVVFGEPSLFAGLTPYPGSWRSKIRPLKTLPHFPMVLHRGGYPDGS
jgi:DNA-binding MarR family transcriptional regulator